MINIPCLILVELTEEEARDYLGYVQSDEEPVNENELQRLLKRDLHQWVRKNVKNNS